MTTVNRHGRFARYVPLFLCILLILFFSSGDASMTNTSRFIRPFLEYIFPAANEETLLFYHALIRKCAHITEYALLGMIAGRAFYNSTSAFVVQWWPCAVMIVVFFVAATDETNQSFNPSRTGSIADVAIDVLGGLIGLIFYFVLIRFLPSKSNPDSEALHAS